MFDEVLVRIDPTVHQVIVATVSVCKNSVYVYTHIRCTNAKPVLVWVQLLVLYCTLTIILCSYHEFNKCVLHMLLSQVENLQ